MTTPKLNRLYPNLTAEERVQLIFAAMSREDEVEVSRLMKAATTITRTMPDHAPRSNAFFDLATMIFVDLVECAAVYRDAWERTNRRAKLRPGKQAQDENEEERVEVEEEGDRTPLPNSSSSREENRNPRGREGKRDLDTRLVDLALAAGCQLRERGMGWILFCERQGVPPYVLWERMPGYDRLKKTLEMAESIAFTPNGHRRWLNRIRPSGTAKLEIASLTAKRIAKETEAIYRKLLTKWGQR